MNPRTATWEGFLVALDMLKALSTTILTLVAWLNWKRIWVERKLSAFGEYTPSVQVTITPPVSAKRATLPRSWKRDSSRAIDARREAARRVDGPAGDPRSVRQNLKGKVQVSGLTGANHDFGGLGTVSLVPGRDGVFAWQEIGKGESAVAIRDSMVRVLEHSQNTIHPRVQFAADTNEFWLAEVHDHRSSAGGCERFHS